MVIDKTIKLSTMWLQFSAHKSSLRFFSVCRPLLSKASDEVHGKLGAEDIVSKTMKRKLALEKTQTTPAVFQPLPPQVYDSMHLQHAQQNVQRPSFIHSFIQGAGMTVAFVAVAGLLRAIGF